MHGLVQRREQSNLNDTQQQDRGQDQPGCGV
jgi:hypothetical protein